MWVKTMVKIIQYSMPYPYETWLKRAKANLGVFYTHIGGDIILLAIHIDNCVFTGSNIALLTEFKLKFVAIYKLTDLGPISWLLGIKVT
jgi:hypothetical protein